MIRIIKKNKDKLLLWSPMFERTLEAVMLVFPHCPARYIGNGIFVVNLKIEEV